METHAHHLHKAPGKKWTHYLFEFLMLFLAVFCGFLAENQREHMVERRREKDYMINMLEDIKADTANLNRIIKSRTTKDHSLDSLSHMMNSKSPASFAKEIYFYAASIARTLPYRFVPNDGTTLQLKNSGSMRLIHKPAVVDSIIKYDVNVRNILGQWSVEEGIIEFYRTAATKIFDALAFEPMFDENLNVVRLPVNDPTFQSYNKRELYEWNYRVYGIKAINKASRRDFKLLLQQAGNLLAILKAEYHLE
jgi:hypothetical protein